MFKFKFRAEPKDILIFIIFCIALLYLCAIAVLNLSSFAQEGIFHGLNPFPAFAPDTIAATFLCFFLFLALIFTSVSSYFFDREKGIGIKAEAKKESGYARWSTDKEMKKELKKVSPGEYNSDVAGIPLINNGKEIWVDAGEYHNLIIGSTGSGKTEMMVQPMVKLLAKKGESMIITDPKGEIYERNAQELRERGYNIVLLNFRDPQRGNSWNPLSLPYNLYKSGNSDKANELLDDLALNILYDEKSQNQDPFWEKTSADYFTGLALGLFEDAQEEEINLNSINLMTTLGEEKFAGSTYIKEYFSYKDPAGAAYVNASSTLMAPTDTKGSILSVFKQKIKLFASRENISEMLCRSDFDMKEIGRQKTAVFLVIQDEKKTYHSLVTIFLKQCYETLIDVAQESGGKLPYKTNFILDEFANMPPLKDVTTMVTAARSRNIRFSFIIQNFAQLNQVYGKENGETIKGNCGNIIYLISSELAALEEISKMCGEVKSKEKDKTASTPLVTVSDLQRLKQWSIIVLRIRQMPYKTVMTPNWKMEKEKMWGKSYEKAGYPSREKLPIKTFDIKGFVEKKKEDKINEMLGNFGGGSMPADSPFPGGGATPFPGFAPSPKKQSGGLDIDELVKRIDAKIAALEEEERLEKEKAEAGAVENDKEETNSESVVDALNPIIENETDSTETDETSGNLEIEIPTVETEIASPRFIPNIPEKPIIDIENPETIEETPIEKEEINKPVEKEIVKPEIKIEKQPEPVVEVKPTPIVEENSNEYVTDDQFFDDFFNDDDEY